MVDFLSIGIVGAFLSIAFQQFKSVYGIKAKIWMVVLSIVVGSIYYFLSQTIWWESIVGVLVSASTVYALFLKQ